LKRREGEKFIHFSFPPPLKEKYNATGKGKITELQLLVLMPFSKFVMEEVEA